MKLSLSLFTPERSWERPTVAEQVGAVVSWLKTQDLRPGQVVALLAQPGPEYICCLLALWQLEALVLPLNPRLPKTQLDNLLKQAGAAYCLTDQPELLPEAVKVLDWPQQSRLAQQGGDSASLDFVPQTPCSLILTSGSSGQPKLALQRFGHHFASAESLFRRFPLQAQDCWLLALPLFHVGGLAIVIRAGLAGARIAIPEPDQSLSQALIALQPSHLSLVATQLQRLLLNPEALRALQTAKFILLGGSAIPQTLLEEASWLGLRVHTSYGSTETCSLVSCTPAQADLGCLLSSGLPLPGHELRISSQGEIQIKSPAVFAGYFSSQASPEQIYAGSIFEADYQLEQPLSPDGWLQTKDRGQFNPEGMLQVMGRLDNLFISGGENIQPEEIEAALLSLPGIQQAMVVAVSDSEFGQRPAAFIEAQDWQPQSWQQALRLLLTGFKLPQAYYRWPQGQTGLKPSRKLLQAEAERLHKLQHSLDYQELPPGEYFV